MADIVNAFPLSIYRNTLAMDPQVKARMIDTVLAMGRAQPRKTKGRTWTGDINGFGFLHQDHRFAELFAAFPGHLRQYLDYLKIDADKLCLYYTRSWATVSQGRENIAPHRHRLSHISLVYYLRKPANSGGIRFMDADAPNQFAPYLFREEMLTHGVVKQPTLVNTRAITLEPKEDDVWIFPSMVEHATEYNLSDEPRLSIAVDIVTTIKDSEVLEFMLPDLDRWTLAS
jgi:uncharacterized protein (TIGR02466 family)